MAVYFITSEIVHAVKIGFTKNPQRRLMNCQSASPVRLHLSAVDEDGDYLTEAELLWRFRAIRSHGEWMTSTPEMLTVIEATAKTGAVPNAWYLPIGYQFKDHNDCTRGATLKDLSARFGVGWRTICEISGTNYQSGGGTYLGVNLRFIPMIWEYLTSKGDQVHPHDLLDQNRLAELNVRKAA